MIVFDENVIDEPLWVPRHDWEDLLSMRQDIKLKNFTYYDNLAHARLPLVAQELDFSSMMSEPDSDHD